MPVLELLRPIPPIAWIPLSIAIFGIGDMSAFFVIFVGAFFPVFTSTAFGIRSVPTGYLDAARVLGANRRQQFLHVQWPAALPHVFVGYRVGLGFSWMCVIAAEMIAASSGLGYSIQLNRLTFRNDRVVACMVAIAVVGILMTAALDRIRRLLIPWASNSVPISLGEQASDGEQLAPELIPGVADKKGGPAGLSISSRQVHFAYPGSGPVIAEMDADVPQGQVLCLLGPSGCGKTTFLRLLAGLEQPSSGVIEFDGTPQALPHPSVAMVFQGYWLFPWKTALENVAFGLIVRGEDVLRARKQAEMILRAFGLGTRVNHYPDQLSGGQQQRVALARALVVRPKVLLLDEPFTALDQQNRETLQEDICKLITKLGMTVVMVTHNVEEAILMSDTVMVMTRESRVFQSVLVRGDRPRAHEFLDSESARRLAKRLRGHLFEAASVSAPDPGAHP